MSLRTKLEKALFRTLRMPTCEEVEGFSYDFLEGRLDPKITRQVERHLKICPHCIRFMEAYRKIRALGSKEEAPPLDREFKEEIFRFLMKSGTRSPRR